jgi:hypothetical protein
MPPLERLQSPKVDAVGAKLDAISVQVPALASQGPASNQGR